jgi:hypothetical protein
MKTRSVLLILALLLSFSCKAKSDPADAAEDPDAVEDAVEVEEDAGDDDVDDATDAPPDTLSSALLVDLDLLHHSAWLDLRSAADDASITLDYRRFFPHVTPADTQGASAYQMIIVAGGGAPGMAAAQLSVQERQTLVDFVQAGGVLVLLPQPTRLDSYYGENDWFVMNLVLEDLESAMRIDKGSLLGALYLGDPEPAHLDDEIGYATLLEFDMGYAWLQPNAATDLVLEGPLPSGRATVLRTSPGDVEVLLSALPGARVWIRTAGTLFEQLWTVMDERPVAAVERLGDGLVAIAPRYLVTLRGAGGQVSEHPAAATAAMDRVPAFVDFLVSHLRDLHDGTTTFSPTDPSMGRDDPFCVGAPGMPPRCPGLSVTIAAAPSTWDVPDAPPDGDHVEAFTDADPADPPPTVPLFGTDPGRIGYGGMPWDATQAATVFSEAATLGLHAMVGGFTPETLVTGEMSTTDADAKRAKMAELADVAEAQAARWLVGSYYTGHVYNSNPSAFPSRSVGAQNQTYSAPPLLYQPLWDDYLIPAAVEVATVSATHPGIAGILVDMEMYGTVLTYSDAQAFDDTTYDTYLATVTDAGVRSMLEAQPVQARLDALIGAGLLRDYITTLHDAAADVGARYRAAVDALDADLAIALYFPGYPTAWQYRGLIEGLGTPTHPVIVLSYDPYSRPARASQVAGGTSVVHLGGPIVSHFPPTLLTTVLENCTGYTDGFWYFSHDEISAGGTGDLAHGTREAYRDAILAAGD